MDKVGKKAVQGGAVMAVAIAIVKLYIVKNNIPAEEQALYLSIFPIIIAMIVNVVRNYLKHRFGIKFF